MSKSSGRTGPPSQRRTAVFHPEFIEDLRYWVREDRWKGGDKLRPYTRSGIALRALDLVDAVLRDPFTGLGKPERLKYLAPGVWSRRLTLEHRVVYFVADDRVDFVQCRYHY